MLERQVLEIEILVLAEAEILADSRYRLTTHWQSGAIQPILGKSFSHNFLKEQLVDDPR